MAWTFDLPSCLQLRPNIDEGIFTSTVKPVYDGKNIWYVSKDKKNVCIVDFWGPFANETNGEFTRHLQPEDDELRVGGRGPDIQILKVYSAPITEFIMSLTYMDGAVYALGASGSIYRMFADLRESSSSKISVPRGTESVLVDLIDITPICRTICVSESKSAPVSQLLGANGRLYFVEPLLETQISPDAQSLCWVNIADIVAGNPLLLSGSTVIPGRKQKALRTLTLANDHIFVSAFNELSVYKFDLLGAFVSSIQVNRDIEDVSEFNNEVWVVSSDKSPLIFGDGEDEREVSSYMVSKISVLDAVTHVVGIPNTSSAVKPEVSLAITNDDIWAISKNKSFARIKRSNLRAILSDTLVAEGSDYNFESSHKAYLGGLSLNSNRYVSNVTIGLKATSTSTNQNGLNTLLITPQSTYQWFNGTTFDTIVVPQYLIMMCDDKIIVQRLSSAIKWLTTYSLNNYAALSTGPRRYKAD